MKTNKTRVVKRMLKHKLLAIGFCGALGAAAHAAEIPDFLKDFSLGGTLDTGIYRDFEGKMRVGGISRSNIGVNLDHKINNEVSVIGRLDKRFILGNGSDEDTKTVFSTESTLGLKGDSWGQVRFGRALTAIWQYDWFFDPWQNYDAVASPAWFLWHGYTPADPNFSTKGASFSRLNNGLYYNSPIFLSGFKLAISYGVEKKTNSATGIEDRTHSASASLLYETGGLLANIAAERNPMDDKAYFAAIKYKFGDFTPMLAYSYEKPFDSIKSGVPFGKSKINAPTFSVNYDLGKYTFKAGYGRNIEAKANFVGLGAVYALDKKTNIYTSYGYKQKDISSNKTGQAFGVGINYTIN